MLPAPTNMASWTAVFDDEGEELGELLDLALGDNDATAAAAAAHKRRMAAAAAAIFPQEGGQGPGGQEGEGEGVLLGGRVRRLTETQFQRYLVSDFSVSVAVKVIPMAQRFKVSEYKSVLPTCMIPEPRDPVGADSYPYTSLYSYTSLKYSGA